MALDRMGLGAIFTLNTSQAVKSSRTASASIGNLKQGLTQLSMATLPVAVAMGGLVKSAADFNKQSSAVEAVSSANVQQMAGLRKQAKMLSLDTKFSSKEAMEGMEVVARAGMNVAETMAAMRPIMDAAAADNMELAAAADVVSSAIRGMGLEATDATRVADVMAKASASSNTNITLIGEAMRYAQSQAKIMGVSLETLVASIGALGDSGLKGSIAGTSFANMLIKMAKPSGKATKLMEKHNVGLKNFADGSLDVISTLKSLEPALKKMTLAQEKAAFVSELFGIRGQKAVSAVATAIEKGRFELLHDKLNNANGAARAMAEIQLDNTIGQFTKLRKAVGVLATEIFDPFLSSLKGAFSGLHRSLSNVLKASIEIGEAQDDFDVEKVRKKWGIYAEIALGIKDAADSLKESFDAMTAAFGKAGEKLKEVFGEGGLRDLTKYIVLGSVFLGLLAPIGLGIAGIALAVGGLAKVFAGLGGTIAAVFTAMNPWLLAAIVLFGIFITLTEGWGPMWQGMSEWIGQSIQWISFAFEDAVEHIGEAFGRLGDVAGALDGFWSNTGTGIIGILTAVIVGLIKVIEFVAVFVANFIGMFAEVSASVGKIFNGLLKIIDGDFIGGMKEIFGGLINIVLTPFRFIAKQIISLAKGAHLGGMIPAGLEAFAFGGSNADPDKTQNYRGMKDPKNRRGVKEETFSEKFARYRRLVEKNQDDSMKVFGGEYRNDLEGIIGKRLDKVAENTGAGQTTELCIDGNKVGKATNKHRQIDKERGGGKTSPWQRRRALQTSTT